MTPVQGAKAAPSRNGTVHVVVKVTRTGAVACLCGAIFTGAHTAGLTGPECATCKVLAS